MRAVTRTLARAVVLMAAAGLAGGVAFAQHAHPPQTMESMSPAPGDSDATRGYKMAMMRMMQDSAAAKYSGDADRDFMIQMRAHHQAAIDMSKVVLAAGKDDKVKALAKEIIVAQEKEIADIDAWLAARK